MSYIDLTDGTKLVSKVVSPEITEKEGRIVALVSTSNVDSDNDIIHQGPSEKGKGWLTDSFNANPIMTWSHELGRPNFGGGPVKLGQHDKHGLALFWEPEFDMNDPFAVTIRNKVLSGYIKKTSVGFRGLKAEPRADQKYGLEFHEQELHEMAWCNIGANNDTEVHIKAMLGRSSELVGLVDGKDCQDVETIKAELSEANDILAERIKVLEAIVSDDGL